MADLVESPTAPRNVHGIVPESLHVIPVNQVRDRYLSSNCHKRVNLLQIILPVAMFGINKDDLLRRYASPLLCSHR